jgi:hypothetical protein
VKQQRTNVRNVRRIGALILAVAAIGIFFGMAPESHASDVSAIMMADSADQARAQGAPQQTVVNGWTTRNLLELISQQLDANQDPRPAALLTLAVLGLALYIFTSEPSGRPSPVEATQAGPHAGQAVGAAMKSRPMALRREEDHGADSQSGLSTTPSTLNAAGRK